MVVLFVLCTTVPLKFEMTFWRWHFGIALQKCNAQVVMRKMNRLIGVRHITNSAFSLAVHHYWSLMCL